MKAACIVKGPSLCSSSSQQMATGSYRFFKQEWQSLGSGWTTRNLILDPVLWEAVPAKQIPVLPWLLGSKMAYPRTPFQVHCATWRPLTLSLGAAFWHGYLDIMQNVPVHGCAFAFVHSQLNAGIARSSSPAVTPMTPELHLPPILCQLPAAGAIHNLLWVALNLRERFYQLGAAQKEDYFPFT